MDLKLSSTFAAQNLVKLYPEYLRRLQKQSQKSPGKSEIKRTIRQLSQSTDLIPQHSTKVNDNRITKSVETINTVVNHHEIEPVEEIPTWLDEPLDRPDKNFAKMARDAGELDKEIAELHNFKPGISIISFKKKLYIQNHIIESSRNLKQIRILPLEVVKVVTFGAFHLYKDPDLIYLILNFNLLRVFGCYMFEISKQFKVACINL
jgi:hypothetical protein